MDVKRPCRALQPWQVEARLESYQALWDGLDDLDAHAWVLEPELPPRGATHRRLALGGHTSLTLDLNPRAPTQPPDFHFMGAVRRTILRLGFTGPSVPITAR
eukprot:250610-Prorocentrum_minimum.AAC.2